MRFPTRRVPAATYAAVLDDRVLWLALAEPADVTLSPTTGGTEVGPSGRDDTQPGHHGLRFDLGSLPLGVASWDLRVGRGKPLLGPTPRPVPAGAEFALTRDDTTALHVVRRPLTPAATLRAVRLLGDAVELRLDLPVGDGSALHLLDGDETVASLPLGPDGTVTLAAATLAPLAPGERTVRLVVAGQPVRRRRTDLTDPGAGVPLPAVHPVGSPTPRARLRWSPEATLVLRLLDRPGQEQG